MSAQLPLVMRDSDLAVLHAARVRKLLRSVAEEIGIKALGDDWRSRDGRPVGHATVNHKLAGTEGRNVGLEEFVDLLLRDRLDLRILAALCDLSGCEPPERKRVLEPGEKLERLDGALDDVLGPEVAELVRRKAGLL